MLLCTNITDSGSGAACLGHNEHRSMRNLTAGLSAHAALGKSNKSEFVVTDPVNLPDLIRKHFGKQKWAGSYTPDPTFPHPIWFHFFQRRHGSCYAKLRSDLNGLVMDWPITHGLEACRCAGITGPSFWQEASGPLPVFHCQTRLCSSTDVPNHIVQNRPGSDLVLTDCVRLWQMDLSREKTVCKNHQVHFWPALPI